MFAQLSSARVKKLVIVGGVAIAALAGAGYFLLTSQFTECYGSFKTEEAAERAADAAEDAGLGASVGHRPTNSAVTFDTGETGADAAEDRETFREVLRQEDGELAHPGDGCVERGSFE
jgi:hypothetical protein